MISICIIVKNEADNLNKCLQNLSKLDNEIIVVDTGSTDNTKEVAKQFTDNVYDFVWCNDFSAARNYAISKSTNEYILMVDSDEFVTKFDIIQVEKLIKRHPTDVGRIHRNNCYVRNDFGFNSIELVNRVFSKQYYQYKGKIHEQIVALKGDVYHTYPIPIYVDHSGYDGSIEQRRKKSERNIHLLEQALMEDGEDPYIYYQLGKGYYLQEDFPKAVEYFDKALTFDLNTGLEYVIDMVEVYGYALINSNQNAQALLLENIYDEFSKSADFVYLMGFIYMQNAMFDKAIAEFLKAAGYKECKVQGVNSFLAYYNAGVIYECLGDKKNALYYYEKSGNYEQAKQGINRCRRED